MCILGLGMDSRAWLYAGRQLRLSAEEQGDRSRFRPAAVHTWFYRRPLVGTYCIRSDGALPYWFAFASYFFLFLFTLRIEHLKS